MKRVVVVGAVLFAAYVAFASSGLMAQRTMVGAPDGSAGASTVPVTVANFPQVQPVQVDKTVNVTGSVAVTNLPAVQQVGGAVTIANLPLDADGNLRVTAASACQGHRNQFVKVTDGTLIGQVQAAGTDPYSLAGWSNVQVFFRATFPVGNFATCLSLVPEFGQGDVFGPAPWSGPQVCYPGGGSGGSITGNVTGGPVLGPELKFLLSGGSSLSGTSLEVWLYLTD